MLPVGLTFTVQATVEKIEFTMSEPVTVVTGTEVTPWRAHGLVTVSADGLTNAYPGNTVANLTGTFISVPEGKIFDLSGNPGTLSATMIVMPALAVTDGPVLGPTR